MTWRFAANTEWSCDQCGRIAYSLGMKLPDGWTQKVEGEGTSDGSTHWFSHRCPECSPPEPKP